MNLHLLFASLAATLSLGFAVQAAPTKIACVGDSITFGSGLKPGDARYPEVLATLMGPGYDVKGFGNPGKTAGDYPGQAGRWFGSTPQHKQALDFKADIYISNLGINDTGRWWNSGLFVKGYEDLFKAWKSASPKAKFFAWGMLGPDYRGPLGKKAFPGNCYPDVRKYALSDNGSAANRPEAEKLIASVARKHKIALFDALTPLSGHPEWYVDSTYSQSDEECGRSHRGDSDHGGAGAMTPRRSPGRSIGTGDDSHFLLYFIFPRPFPRGTVFFFARRHWPSKEMEEWKLYCVLFEHFCFRQGHIVHGTESMQIFRMLPAGISCHKHQHGLRHSAVASGRGRDDAGARHPEAEHAPQRKLGHV
ncbi:MAG: GDSL-type esterase/lipase family protein [Akkermansia sp.]